MSTAATETGQSTVALEAEHQADLARSGLCMKRWLTQHGIATLGILA
jgi:hypothetical protein